MNPSPIARLQLLATAVLFSSGGAVIKACALTGWQVACVRSGVAALTLLLVLPEARRSWSWPGVLVGGACGATMVLFTLSNKLTTAASSIFLQSTAPLYLLLLGPWLLHEPIRRHDLPFMLALAAGLALSCAGADGSRASAPDPLRGNLLAACSGITWALTVSGLRWLAARSVPGPDGARPTSPIPTLVVGNVIACLVCLPGALPLQGARPVDWLLLAYLGIFQIALAYMLFTRALRQVPALEASLLLLLEPVLNPLWAWALHGEYPGPWPLAGGAVIVVATALRSLRLASPVSRLAATRR